MGHIFEAYPPPPPLSLQFFGLCVYPIKAVSFPATSSLSISEVGVMSKTTTLQVHHAFLYSSLPSLHNYDVKTPDRKLNGGRKQGMTNFYFLLLNLSAVPK